MNNKLNTKLILDYIKNNNLTKKEFCRKCKISTSTLYKIINEKDFQLIALFKIAKIMNLKPYRFFE
ncbi:MAG: helix-turn-helix domain-containing protein [Clostridia bacterium]|nr:helix-turn-helix domain-containing protein [Clostridia bacterium]